MYMTAVRSSSSTVRIVPPIASGRGDMALRWWWWWWIAGLWFAGAWQVKTVPDPPKTWGDVAGIVFVVVTAWTILIWARGRIWNAVAPWVGRFRLERGDGFALRYVPAIRPGKKRLQREIKGLIRDVREYLEKNPSLMVASLTEHERMVSEMEAAPDEAAKREIWNRSTQRTLEAFEAERRDLGARFGGRAQYLIQEFARRGMLTEPDAHRLQWGCQSAHGMVEAATTLEALALRL